MRSTIKLGAVLAVERHRTGEKLSLTHLNHMGPRVAVANGVARSTRSRD